ncbi:MAG: putative permease [Verrucomicrobiales bacterium]|nr:putative permease [Verrucomicrobiales bacterium]
MKTLHLYVTRQILGTLVMTVLVFTFVLLIGNILRDVMSLLMNGQASLWVSIQAIGLLIPYVLVFALPMGLLTATLLTFGRFSADHELTAVRASGISLLALITPILILSVVLSGLCALINLQLAPQARDAYKSLYYRVTMENPSVWLREKQYVTFGVYGIYIDRRNGDDLLDIEVSQVDENGTLIRWFRAPRGQLVPEPQNSRIMLHLVNPRGVAQEGGEWNKPIRGDFFDLPIRAEAQSVQATKLSDMTFTQLRTKIRELEELNRQQPPLEKLPPELQEQMKKSKVLDFAMPAKVQLHRMLSFSFACIGFTLVGIPLGIRAHRRETSIGIAFALMLVVVYYSFLILGGALEGRPELYPHLIVWLPNFIFQIIGAGLLWRANKGLH